MTWMAATDAGTRPLRPEEEEGIARFRKEAHRLYEGVQVAHHSCGASIAVTFSSDPRPYQSLRRGGLSGNRFCGSIRGGELLLGEVLGDPSPSGSVTDELRSAMSWYQEEIPKRFPAKDDDYRCNSLTAPQGDFFGPLRKKFCTELTADVAALAGEALARFSPQTFLRLSKELQ